MNVHSHKEIEIMIPLYSPCDNLIIVVSIEEETVLMCGGDEWFFAWVQRVSGSKERRG